MSYNVLIGADPRVHYCERDSSPDVPGAGSGRNYAYCESNIFIPWDPRHPKFTNEPVTCVFCVSGTMAGFAAVTKDEYAEILAADAAVKGPL